MVSAAFDGGSDDNISVAIAEYGEMPRGTETTTTVLSFDGEAAAMEAPATLVDQPAVRSSRPAAVLGDPAPGVEEEALVAGFPMGALVAVVVVVAAVAAILVFGG
jgi:hypothetical protein